MTNKGQLQKLTWHKVSIVKHFNDTLLVVLFFKTKEEGTGFLRDFISKEPFKFLITKNDKGNHTFVVQFESLGYDLVLETKMTTESYPPLTWLDDYKGKTFLTTGEYQKNGKFIMDTYQHPLNVE